MPNDPQNEILIPVLPESTPKLRRNIFYAIVSSVVLLVLFVCVRPALDHEINEIIHEPKLGLAFAGLVFGVTVISALICSFFTRAFLQNSLNQDLSKLQEIRRLLENASDKILRVATVEELSKKGGWLVNDDEAQQIEKNVDAKIKVISTDLFFERQAEWLEIIAENICRKEGPVYEYFVQDVAANKMEEIHIRAELEKLVTRWQVPPGSARQWVRDRFKVMYLDRSHFPNLVYNGVAIYRFKNPTKDRCLLYFPREQWNWNLDLFAGDSASRKRANEFVAEAENHLTVLPTKP